MHHKDKIFTLQYPDKSDTVSINCLKPTVEHSVHQSDYDNYDDLVSIAKSNFDSSLDQGWANFSHDGPDL